MGEERIRTFISVLLFSLLVFLLFLKSIKDPDFFWHLKTGEYIFKHKSIPEKDPFSFTAPDPPTERVKFILKQYWLSQILFYLLYRYFGFNGIIVSRAILFTLIILCLFRMIRKNGIGYYLCFPFLLLFILIAFDFKGDRPQLFSFLGVTILVYILEFNRTFLFLLPLIMLIWANMHGGYILGDVIIVIYLGSYWIKRLFRLKGKAPENLYLFSIISITSIIFSFINPNTFKVIQAIFELEKSIFRREVTEYLSPLEQIRYLHNYWLPFWILLGMVITVIIIHLKDMELEHLILLLFLSGISFTAIRYIIFLGIVTIPLLTKYLFLDLDRFSFLNKRYNSLDLLLIIILGFLILKSSKHISFGISKDVYPVNVSNFLLRNRIKGNMFNLYNWGGYLIWALYPKYKVSIDPRGLNERVHMDFEMILSGAGKKERVPRWKRLLEKYRINFILINTCDPFSGALYPLIPLLMNDREWELIYMDGQAVIFLRKTEKNMELIRRFSIPKERVYDEIIQESMRGIKSRPYISGYYTSLAHALIGKGEYRHAKLVLIKAIRLNPKDNVAKEMLRIIEGLGY